MDTVDQPVIPSAHTDKIRVLTLIIFFIIAVLIALYTLLFSEWGNRYVASQIEKELESILEQPITVENFTLTPYCFELSFHDETNNTAHIQGDYSLLPPRINARYNADMPSKDQLNILPLPLKLQGSLQGTYNRLIAQGSLNLFAGTVDYNTSLHTLKPDTLHLKLYHLHYQQLMEYLEYPHNSNTLLKGEIELSGLRSRDIHATANLNASTTVFKPSPLKEDDNESFDFWSLLADEKGKIAPFSLHANLKGNIDELGILEQFVSYPLRSKATLNASLHGTQHHLLLEMNANVAKGMVTSDLSLHKLRPQHLQVVAKEIDTAALFYLLSLPHPIEGKLNGSLNSNGSDTMINVALNKGQTNPPVLKKHYHISQPLIHFNTTMKMTISPSSTHTTGTFKSDLEELRFDGSPTHEQMLQELLRQIKQRGTKANF